MAHKPFLMLIFAVIVAGALTVWLAAIFAPDLSPALLALPALVLAVLLRWRKS